MHIISKLCGLNRFHLNLYLEVFFLQRSWNYKYTLIANVLNGIKEC